MRVVAEVAFVLGLMLLNGALAMSELAMMSSRRGRLEQLAIDGNRGARAALRLLEDPTGFLSTVQFGITLVGILAGAYSGATLGGHLADALTAAGVPAATAHTLAISGVVVLVTYLSLIVGELVPKRLALADPERIASRAAAPMTLIARIGTPVVWILRSSTNAVLRLLGVSPARVMLASRRRSSPACWPRLPVLAWSSRSSTRCSMPSCILPIGRCGRS